MSNIIRLYKRGNYTIQKSINIEDTLYTKIKEFADEDYEATISDIINICIEDFIVKEDKDIQFYNKPKWELTIYRSVMIRKDNIDALCRIKNRTGISFTRLVNMAIKEFLQKYEKI